MNLLTDLALPKGRPVLAGPVPVPSSPKPVAISDTDWSPVGNCLWEAMKEENEKTLPSH